MSKTPMSKKLCTMERGQIRSQLAFDMLHAVYHERDFRVRVNEGTIEQVRRTLAASVGRPPTHGGCPACLAGFEVKTHGEMCENRLRCVVPEKQS